MKKGDKKAQYYLFAAFVIVGIIIGFVAILNYSKRNPPVRVYDVAEELEIESEAVWDYYKMKNEYQIDVFTKNFNDYAGSGIDIYFVNDTDGFAYDDKGELYFIPFQKTGGIITVNVSEEQYSFNAKPEGNFFFVMIQEAGGERYVAKN